MKRFFCTFFVLFASISSSTFAQAAPHLPEEEMAALLTILEEQDSYSATVPGLHGVYLCQVACYFTYQCGENASPVTEKKEIDVHECAINSVKAEELAEKECDSLVGKRIQRGRPLQNCTIKGIESTWPSCTVQVPHTSCTPS